jgi:hypothetical protein
MPARLGLSMEDEPNFSGLTVTEMAPDFLWFKRELGSSSVHTFDGNKVDLKFIPALKLVAKRTS